MEKLNDCKFQQLSSNEMKQLEGGWGWKLYSTGFLSHDGNSEYTVHTFHYQNIWGNDTGEIKYVTTLDN